MKLLNKYQNGNVTVSLYEDGTKIQEWDGEQKPKFPNSMDIKITNYCDLACRWCHEKSTTEGKHGDLVKLINLLKDLPAGTELAIGGGDPLSHPNILPFLQECKELGLIPNMTVNFKHFSKYSKILNFLINSKLIYGLGLSITDGENLDLLENINNRDNIVYHVIAGVNDITILEKIKQSPVKKVLILGYKEVGRGIDYNSTKVKLIKGIWREFISDYIGNIHMSFDNLAIKQLDIKSHLSEKDWNDFYCGDDATFTMYIDAVKWEYAKSSTSTNDKRPINGSIYDIFQSIRKTEFEMI